MLPFTVIIVCCANQQSYSDYCHVTNHTMYCRAGVVTGRFPARNGVYCANGTEPCANASSPNCCNGVFLPGTRTSSTLRAIFTHFITSQYLFFSALYVCDPTLKVCLVDSRNRRSPLARRLRKAVGMEYPPSSARCVRDCLDVSNIRIMD